MMDSICRADRKIPYSIQGNGEPLFVIGFGSYTYSLLSSRIKNSFKIVTTDYCGLDHESDTFDVDSISLIEILNDIDALRTELGFEKINILGHSNSGTVALDYALSFQEYINKVILVCSPYLYDHQYIDLQKKYMDEYLTGERKKEFENRKDKFNEKVKAGLVEKYFLEYHEVQKPLYWNDYNKEIENYWKDININQAFINNFVDRTYAIYKRKISLKEFPKQIIVFLGKHDYATPPITWKPFMEYGNIRTYLMEKSAHYPMIEERELFDEILINEITT